MVFVGSFDGNIYALNATNGAKLWSYVATDVVTSSPAVADGIVYVGLNDGYLCALNSTTGEVVWKNFLSGAVSSHAVVGGVVFASSSAYVSELTLIGNVYALNSSTGKMLWDYNPKTFVSFPTVVGDIVYLGVGSNVSALNSVNGSQLWSSNLDKQVGLSPIVLRPTAVLDNVLYVGSSDGSVYALNTNNGEKIWNQSLGNKSELLNPVSLKLALTSPAVANGVVYVGSNDGNIYALNAVSGEKQWNYTISDPGYAVESSPAVAHGLVYIGSGARNVYAFGNPTNNNASADTLPVIITIVIAVIIVATAVIIIFKRSKSKSFLSRDSGKRQI
jgi:outer membrane protein assembly factor BamB